MLKHHHHWGKLISNDTMCFDQQKMSWRNSELATNCSFMALNYLDHEHKDTTSRRKPTKKTKGFFSTRSKSVTKVQVILQSNSFCQGLKKSYPCKIRPFFSRCCPNNLHKNNDLNSGSATRRAIFWEDFLGPRTSPRCWVIWSSNTKEAIPTLKR